MVEVVIEDIDYVFQTGWVEERTGNEDVVVVAFHERGHSYSRLGHMSSETVLIVEEEFALQRHSGCLDRDRPNPSLFTGSWSLLE